MEDVTNEYTFSGATGDRVLFSFARTDTAILPTVQIFDPLGNRISYFNDALGGSVTLPALTIAGEYTITVRDDDGDAGSYNYTFVKLPGTHTLDTSEGPLTSGISGSNSLTKGDIDVYTFSGQVGDRALFSFARTDTAILPTVQIFDPLGNRISYFNDALGGSVTLPALTIAGEYTITVRDDDGDAGTYDYTFSKLGVSLIADLDSAPETVLENALDGTPVGITAFATSNNSTHPPVTYSLWNTRGGRFAIDSTTGVVTVANGALLDREVQASWTITVLATSQDGSVSVRDFAIAVQDVDEFNVGKVFDLDSAPNRVAENAANGTTVGITGFGIDLDATNSAVTYSLWNTRAGRFAIDATTGVVTVANGALLDREVQASWTITVLATSQDGSVSVKDFTIAIQDVDDYNVGKVYDLNDAPNSVAENVPNGTPVGITAFAIDLDATHSAVSYSLWNTRGGRFAIHPTTGVVTIANGSLIDREVAASWTITVLATSQDGSISVKDFTIAIEDVDDFNVGKVFDLDAAPNRIVENAPNGTAVGITGFGIDLDATNSAVTYSLWNTRGGRFAIDPTTGVVTVANSGLLDREAQASWTVTILATSQDGSISVKDFTIDVEDVDEYDVVQVYDLDAAPNSVREDASNGTAVGLTGFGIDLDATNRVVSYLLTNNAGGRFAIDAVTGIVTVADASLLDWESAVAWDVVIKATSADGSSSSRSFRIAIENVDETAVT